MTSGDPSIKNQINSAKEKVKSLQAEANIVQQKKLDGFTGIDDLAKTQSQKTELPSFNSTPKLRRTLKGHFGKIYAMQWSCKENELVSASQDGKLIIWNAYTNEKINAIALRSSWVMTCCIEQVQGEMVACGGLDNICTVYRINSVTDTVNQAHRELVGHEGYISCCRFINNEKIITASGDSTCVLWDVEVGTKICDFTAHEGDVMSLDILPKIDSNMFVTGSCDTTARVWDIRTRQPCMTFRGHESDINSITLFPDAKAIGTGSDDATCRIFDLRAYGQVSKFTNEKIICGISSVTFSRSGRALFAGYDDYNCLGWDVLGSQSTPIYQLSGHENRISCIGMSASGDALCTVSWDATLKIWA